MFNAYGIIIVFVGIILIALGWKGTYKNTWTMLKGK